MNKKNDYEIPMHCRVCGVALNAVLKGRETDLRLDYWRHPLGIDDHEPEPVPADAVPDSAVTSLCDFCGKRADTEEQTVFMALGFTVLGVNEATQEGVGTYNDPDWWACSVCTSLIKARDSDRLAIRAATQMERRLRIPYETALAQVSFSHEAFFERWTGLFVPGCEYGKPLVYPSDASD